MILRTIVEGALEHFASRGHHAKYVRVNATLTLAAYALANLITINVLAAATLREVHIYVLDVGRPFILLGLTVLCGAFWYWTGRIAQSRSIQAAPSGRELSRVWRWYVSWSLIGLAIAGVAAIVRL
jgi:hypothetical protein